jgi:hypothetical protein
MTSQDADFTLEAGAPSQDATSFRAVPLQIGDATVFIEQIGEGPVVEASDAIYPVAPDPREAMEHALEFVRASVKTVGERIEGMADRARPAELTVEFTVAFDARGKTSLIPVLVTGEAGMKTGIKITAMWRRDSEGQDGDGAAGPRG